MNKTTFPLCDYLDMREHYHKRIMVTDIFCYQKSITFRPTCNRQQWFHKSFVKNFITYLDDLFWFCCRRKTIYQRHALKVL